MVTDYDTALDSDTSISEALRSRGLRVTAARHAILKWLSSHPHASADEVHQGVLEQLGTLSRQAVYDVLSASVEAELVRQIKPIGHPARFERRIGDNHHHLVCTHCGRVADTDCKHGHAPCLAPADPQGFVIHEAEIMFWGVCSHCRSQTESHHDKG
ncbi:Fur family transcriptional regulator [Salinisphaera sp.]|uniref:Fur family transcriptional regulator n=1 Tax=Salinisphaera sp. TaxID=1914330 RepID=UPI000C6BD1BE|nr:Fur family transcriptional regulator [Salinisphaera sp.]MBS64312.1 transcriptional repressor [Salinisphaera sp.]